MKVIEILKNTQSRTHKHHIIVSDDLSNENIDDLVSDYCEKDISGSNHGYSYEWEIITDDLTKREVICKELIKIDSNISKLLREKESLLKLKEIALEKKYGGK